MRQLLAKEPSEFVSVAEVEELYEVIAGLEQEIEELKALQCIKVVKRCTESSSSINYQVTDHGLRISLLPLTPLLGHLCPRRLRRRCPCS